MKTPGSTATEVPTMAENKNPFFNASGCPDPTAYHGMKSVVQADEALEGKVREVL